MNPHFLYNSLDTMSGIAVSQNCSQVSVLCQALSHIFRYSIDMKDPLFSVDKEILHIKNYMYIVNTRLPEPIEMEIRVSSDVLSVKIPRLSLQPIVENAVNHGLKNARGEKKISIIAEKDGNRMELTISDNGVGMDADEIQRGLSVEPEGTLSLKESIGLSNIHTRIRLLFGKPYGLSLSSGQGKGSSVSLTVPVPENGEQAT